ncbi:hypothetical protein [Streptomyces nigrescens]|uniref:Uncharacterized protein n=1 Tax=Streptomyces bugieae TaxID=3098223 RepID=A0ABU7NUA3_9ACTN|nr:hypothetical protein [Streptomyces nigrescens]MEE4422441.1 hypothetical protein [Streptomyces sp. DSM 41528]
MTQPTEHQSNEYLDRVAIAEFIGHVDSDPGDDTRRFHLAAFARLKDSDYTSHFVFATPGQAIVPGKELGLDGPFMRSGLGCCCRRSLSWWPIGARGVDRPGRVRAGERQ